MRLVRLRPQRCDRAHEWISCAFDSELSELEHMLLDRHLDRCESCRSFDEDVRGLTRTLRAAPLVELAQPITLPRRGPRIAVRPLRAAAVLAVAAVGVGSLFGSLQPSSRVAGSQKQLVMNVDRELAQQRNWQLKQHELAWHIANSKFGGPQQV